MTKAIVSILIALGITFTLSGCAEKQPVVVEKWRDRSVYVKAEPYDFQKVDLTGAYIDFPSVSLRNKCMPAITQAKDVYVGVIKYYEYSVDEYNKGFVDDNKTSK